MNGKNDSCEMIRTQLAMLLYGELSFDEEEAVDAHLESCAECRAALDRERVLHAAFDQAEIEPPAQVLWESRQNLQERIASEHALTSSRGANWWDQFVDALMLRPANGSGWMKPAGALALVTLGFLAARVVPNAGVGVVGMSMADPGAQRVRSVEPAPNGGIQIVLDETRQRIVSGGLDDQNIRVLLLSAAKDPSDPGLRYETVGILNDRAQTAEVRDTLIYALEHDENAGVRLKAMDGLKPFVLQPEVRKALAGVLLSDGNPGMRTQAIDLLTQGVGESTGNIGNALDRDVIGTLQELMNRENNAYVRQRGQRVLQLVNASPETY
ncbi:MAG: putative transrane anti-sigma factor [Bryobacterales bacterium]|nr:putative transrane anti-sigma factor [Bryobacterales bacterium]